MMYDVVPSRQESTISTPQQPRCVLGTRRRESRGGSPLTAAGMARTKQKQPVTAIAVQAVNATSIAPLNSALQVSKIAVLLADALPAAKPCKTSSEQVC